MNEHFPSQFTFSCVSVELEERKTKFRLTASAVKINKLFQFFPKIVPVTHKNIYFRNNHKVENLIQEENFHLVFVPQWKFPRIRRLIKLQKKKTTESKSRAESHLLLKAGRSNINTVRKKNIAWRRLTRNRKYLGRWIIFFSFSLELPTKEKKKNKKRLARDWINILISQQHGLATSCDEQQKFMICRFGYRRR